MACGLPLCPQRRAVRWGVRYCKGCRRDTDYPINLCQVFFVWRTSEGRITRRELAVLHAQTARLCGSCAASLQRFALVVTRRSPCTSHRSDQSRFRCLRKKSKQSSLQPLSHSNTLSTASRNTSAIRNTMSIVVVCLLFSIAMFVSSSQSAKDGASSGPPEGICQSDPILK